LKGRHFDTIEVIKAEHPHSTRLPRWQKLREGCIYTEGNYLQADGG
jgi:hypothetical protein